MFVDFRRVLHSLLIYYLHLLTLIPCDFFTRYRKYQTVVRQIWFRMMTTHVHVVVIVLNTLQRRHNGRDGVSNNQRLICILNRLSRRWSMKSSKLRITGLCEGNSQVPGEFSAQRTSYAENISFWWSSWSKCNVYKVPEIPIPVPADSIAYNCAIRSRWVKIYCTMSRALLRKNNEASCASSQGLLHHQV